MSVPTDISEYLFPSGFVPSEVLWQNQIRADPPGNTCYQYDNNSSAEFYPECYWFWPISSYWSVCLLLRTFPHWNGLQSKIPEDRSEEHTSELQSRGHLVCRLLLEKKKMYK